MRITHLWPWSSKFPVLSAVLLITLRQSSYLVFYIFNNKLSKKKTYIWIYIHSKICGPTRAPIDFGNNRIEPIGNRFSVSKFNLIYRYFSFSKLPFGFGKFSFGFGFS